MVLTLPIVMSYATWHQGPTRAQFKVTVSIARTLSPIIHGARRGQRERIVGHGLRRAKPTVL